MTDTPTGAYSPLYDEQRDGTPALLSLHHAVDLARQALAESAATNIHDSDQTLRTAVRLECRLRALVATLDAEAGR
ncbi:hypothetical protein ACWCXC_17135 [Streptomyces sp. NPDC001515]